ncbi:EG45-like domain containing protein [Magnolia sinica]|uniref:EG45-like domain containing protein n=1 Tax=Magnolia sinica TaxID=86752 RepID=UPI00265A3CBE|nr:EG45-like domain containing protein [Magnolia sinica]
MAMVGHLLILAVVAMGLSFMGAAADKGTATFYTPPYTPSACDGFEEEGVMIAAASDAFWANGAACGHRYKVTCTGATNLGDPHPWRGSRSVVVKIVDYCPAGCRGTIDLSQEAFASIADPDAGKINIAFKRI